MEPFLEHDMIPQTDHDEAAFRDYVASLRQHLSTKVMPGTRLVWETKVKPAYERTHGEEPGDEATIRDLMTGDPFYQFWSASQRNSQQLMWDAVMFPAERRLDELSAQYRRLAGTGNPRGSLRLNPDLALPRYLTAFDIHLQPGGYCGEFCEDDVTAGLAYDWSLPIYLHGAVGPRNEVMGNVLINHLANAYPDHQPSRILDMGCGMGNSTTAWAEAFPDAEVHAIDCAAGMLRYGHARAEAMELPIHFSQQNAEATDFEDGSFDLVVSHIMLHETSMRAVPRIVHECARLLRPGGLMMHLEIPRGQGSAFEQFMYNWETYNNNEAFAGVISELDIPAMATDAGFTQAEKVSAPPFVGKGRANYTESMPPWPVYEGLR
jgi:ubiquinone/menaquinone biosynthesis C-methylase UbiE